MTYSKKQAEERQRFWKFRFRTPQRENAAERLAETVVGLERELDQRRHQAQILVLLEDEARELGFEGSADESPLHQLIDAYKEATRG